MTTRSHDSDDTSGTESIRESAPAPVGGPPTEIAVPEAHEGPAARTSDQAQPPVVDSSAGLLGSAWVGLVLGAIVTILLLIFIAQNTTATEVQYLGLHFTLPLGVLILLAAIAGALIMALFAGFRILQLRMRARKARKIAR